MPTKLSNEIITAAIAGFEQQKVQIDVQIAELRVLLSGDSSQPAATAEPTRRKRRKMSAAGRARIGEAQRKRWAALKGEPEAGAVKTAKPKRKLSAAGRKAIVAATKKRWALIHAEAAKSKPAAKTTPAKAVAKKGTARKATAQTRAKRAAKTAEVPTPEAGAQ